MELLTKYFGKFLEIIRAKYMSCNKKLPSQENAYDFCEICKVVLL